MTQTGKNKPKKTSKATKKRPKTISYSLYSRCTLAKASKDPVTKLKMPHPPTLSNYGLGATFGERCTFPANSSMINHIDIICRTGKCKKSRSAFIREAIAAKLKKYKGKACAKS